MRRASTTHFQPTRIALAAITKAGDNFLHESRDLASADHQLEQFSRLLYLGAQHPPQRRRLEQWFEQQLASPTVAQNEFQRQFLQFGHEVLQQFTDVAGHKSFAPVPQNARQRRNEQAPAQFALKLANSVWQASAALQSGNVTLAEKSLNKLAAEIPTQPLWLNLRGWWHIARGKLHYAQGEMPAAGEQLALAINQFRALRNDLGQAAAQQLQAKLLFWEGRYLETRGALLELLRLREKGGDLLGIGKAHLLSGRICRHENRHDAALEAFEYAWQIARQIGHPAFQAMVRHFRGDAFLALGRIREARIEHQKNSVAPIGSDDRVTPWVSQYALLNIDWREACNLTDPRQRRQKLERTLIDCRALVAGAVSRRSRAKLDLLMARIHRALEARAAAVDLYERAANEFAAMRLVGEQCTVLAECGVVKHEQGAHGEAAICFVRALKLPVSAELRQLVLDNMQRTLANLPLEQTVNLLADLEAERLHLTQRLQQTGETYLKSLEILRTREVAMRRTITHALLAAVQHHGEGPWSDAARLAFDVWGQLWNDLGVGESLQLAPLPFSTVLEELRTNGIAEISLVGKSNLPEVCITADRRHLLFSLRNCLRILVRLSPSKTPRVTLELLPVVAEKALQLTFRCTGKPVDEQLMTRLADAAATAGRPEQLGLAPEDWPGLLIAQACITVMGGTLAFRSSPEKTGRATNAFIASLRLANTVGSETPVESRKVDA